MIIKHLLFYFILNYDDVHISFHLFVYVLTIFVSVIILYFSFLGIGGNNINYHNK